MKLLLQASIHLIKKVITFVIYERSVQVSKACTLFCFFPAAFFLLADNCFSSHRFHRSPQIFFIGRFFIGSSSWEIFHRISRMNRKAFLLIGLLTDFRGYLASGQWLAPDICSCCFCHADFAENLRINSVSSDE